eukprot:TRINITY_DN1334_c0_g1_i1.p1 TRINITY_DN1334_c0_g1~~TRINITY_DN1334_c0_g1_i1.p1  ORF type:complete len:246 (-),score=67.84 TRINITY_DN1334_c0_g1_i1:61-798(-)
MKGEKPQFFCVDEFLRSLVAGALLPTPSVVPPVSMTPVVPPAALPAQGTVPQVAAKKDLFDDEPDERKVIPVPLEREWTFWYDNYATVATRGGIIASEEQFMAHLFNVTEVTTVQEFWQGFNNIPTFDRFPLRCSLYFMRKGIKPLWEDPANKSGGILTLHIKRDDTQAFWRELLLAVIGEQFTQYMEANTNINGVSVSIRAETIVRVWLSSCEKSPLMLYNAVRLLVPKVDVGNYLFAPNSKPK